MGSKKNVSMSETEVKYKVLSENDTNNTEASVANDSHLKSSPAPKAGKKSRVASSEAATDAKNSDKSNTDNTVTKTQPHSARYRRARAQVDKTKSYSPTEAVELIKKLSYTKFVGTISVDGVMTAIGDKFDLTFPHTTGQKIRVAIVDDDLLTKIEAGELNFDVLLTHPQYMPRLAKFARILGPKGLMPNPKNGTITPNPEARRSELEAGKTTIKTEKKAPLIHVSIGKTTDSTTDLVDNIQALVKASGRRLIRLTITATMSPGVKVDISSLT